MSHITCIVKSERNQGHLHLFENENERRSLGSSVPALLLTGHPENGSDVADMAKQHWSSCVPLT